MKCILQFKWVVFLAVLLLAAVNSFAQYSVIVAQDGSGNYTTVQAAINAAPTTATSGSPWVIYIKNGTYNEVVSIPSTKPFLQLVGQSVEKTIIAYNNGASTIVNGSALGTNNSATLTVSASDCLLMNLTIQNTFGDGSQAVAVLLNNDRIAVKNCRLMGNQDTLYTKGTGTPRHYFRNCYIDGNIDFMFGSSVDIFDSCVVYAKTRTSAGSSFCTAVNTTAGQSYGYVFRNCILPANTLLGTTSGTSYYLGRPWQNSTGFTTASNPAQANNKVAYLNCTLGAHINPAGWVIWDSGTDTTKISDAEYTSKNFDGTATNISSRVTWSQQLTTAQDTTYTTSNIFNVSGTTWGPCPTVGCSVFTPDIAISNFKATKGTSSSTLAWNISWPISGVTYGLYRSSDSITFSLYSTLTSANDTNVNFQLTDTLPTQGNNFYYYVKATKTGYNTDSTTVGTIISKPTIIATSSLAAFTQYNGTPSTSLSFTDSGVNLTAGIVVTPPSNFQVSTDNNTFSSSVTLTPVSGVVHPTTIYVRLNASVLGNYNGNITNATTGGTTVNVAVSGKDTTQPAYTDTVLEVWPLTSGNASSFAITGVTATTPTLSNLFLGGTYSSTVLGPYTNNFGQTLYSGSTSGAGNAYNDVAHGGNAGNLSHIYYEQFTITAAAGYTMRVDSLVTNTGFYNTSSGITMMAVYSKTNFVSDSSNVYGYGFATSGSAPNIDFTLANLTTTDSNNYARFALVGGGSGVTLNSGNSVTIRIYYTCSSTGTPRLFELRNLVLKGIAPSVYTANYYCAATGNLDATATWGTNTDGSGTHPSNFTTQGQVFHISNSNIGNINGSTWTVSGTGSRIKLDNGSDLTISSGHAIVGSIAVGAGRVLTINTTTLPTLDTLAATATIAYGTTITIPSTQTAFPNLQVSAGTTISANTIISGTLMMNGGKLNLNGNTLTINDISGASAASSITGSSTSGLVLNGALSGNLYFDQTSGVTSSLGSLTMNSSSSATLGNSVNVYGTLTMNGGKLNLNGNNLLINDISGSNATRSLTGSSSSGLIINGNLSNSLYFNQASASTATLGTLAVNGNATLGNNVNISAGATPGTVTVGTGATLTAGGNLTILSDVNGTARIGTVSGTISGNVNIQRYVPGQRGYRLIGHPYTTDQDIATLGAYFDITGLTAGNIGSCSSTVPSIYSYTPGSSPAYAGITATGSGTFPAAGSVSTHSNGILAFVRGTTGQGCNGAAVYTPSAVTVSTSSAVNVGGVTETIPAGGWNLISNPLPSQILLSSVTNIGSLDAIKVIDPAGQSSGVASTNGTQYLNGSISTVIPINGAFLAHNPTGSDVTLTFPESAKTGNTPANNVFKTTNVYPALELSVNNGNSFWDNWSMIMKPGTSEGAGDNGDLQKISNAQFDIYSLSKDNIHMNVDARDADSMADGDVVQLGIRSVPKNTYTLTVSQYSLPANKTVYLYDKYTSTYTLLGSGISYPFTVNADTGSQGQYRMELVFNTGNTGVGNISNSVSGVVITPNPATSNIAVSFDNAYAGVKDINVVNVIGQVVKTVTTSAQSVVIPIADLPGGVYLIKTSANNKNVTRRFIKN